MSDGLDLITLSVSPDDVVKINTGLACRAVDLAAGGDNVAAANYRRLRERIWGQRCVQLGEGG